MAKRTTNRTGSGGEGPMAAPRELVVVTRPDHAVRARGGRGEEVASARGADVGALASVLSDAGARLRPMFDDSEERVQALQSQAHAASEGVEGGGMGEMPDLSVFYRVEAEDDALDALAERLAATPSVEGAFVKPPTYPAVLDEVAEAEVRDAPVNDMAPRAADAPPASPDFTPRQGYLESAPGGIDARYAWTQRGGRGWNVRVIDIEGAWNFGHEDLRENQGGVIGTPTGDLGWRNHGTAVVGEIGGDRNAIGVTGIAPDAQCSGVSIFGGMGSARAIREAADRLRPGDVVLIELHRPGPGASGVGQDGFIAIEWWPDDYAAIRYASNKGVIVVEAAGNGFRNLDDPIYDAPAPGFPSDWRNPFRRGVRDSGAVVVGAGAPPPGTHGRDHGPDRSRLGFSNHGALVDAQGWGREVTTTGYGDLQGGGSETLWYTDRFSGTSSASPIVVGALACVQGTLRAQGRIPLGPARARELLRRTGSAQQDAPARPRSQRIGRRPDLRRLIPMAHGDHERIGVQFTGTVPANGTRRWFTHSWPAHWHVLWSVVPTNPHQGGAQVRWDVSVQRSSDSRITYFIAVTNLSSETAFIEARYAILGY